MIIFKLKSVPFLLYLQDHLKQVVCLQYVATKIFTRGKMLKKIESSEVFKDIYCMAINFCNTISLISVFGANSQSVWSCFHLLLPNNTWSMNFTANVYPFFFFKIIVKLVIHFYVFLKKRCDRPDCTTLAALLYVTRSYVLIFSLERKLNWEGKRI